MVMESLSFDPSFSLREGWGGLSLYQLNDYCALVPLMAFWVCWSVLIFSSFFGEILETLIYG